VIKKKTHKLNSISVTEYVLINAVTELSILDFGAAIFKLSYKNRTITVAPESIESFISAPLSYGKTLGRHAGRIEASPFYIDGKTYTPTPPYLGKYQLHGGINGFNHQMFSYENSHENDDFLSLTLSYNSPHLEGGYPGNIHLKVTYYLYKDARIRIEYDAISDEDTYLNITNHIYFNLTGTPSQVLDHTLMIPSNLYIDRTEDFEFISLKNPLGYYDFNHPRKIQLLDDMFRGYDDAYFLNDQDVLLISPDQKLRLEARSSYPVMVLYTHNLPSKLLKNYPNGGLHAGVALEFQYAPNGIHNTLVKLPLLKKDERYHAFIEFEIKDFG